MLQMENTRSMVFKIASEPEEYEQINQLNYATFVDEIPQHQPNQDQSLVDQFHHQNIYFICLTGDNELVGMISLNDQRPFSLDKKIYNLDDYLPSKKPICEIRLLSVKKDFRNSRVFYGLIQQLYHYCMDRGFQLAVISGTARQLKLYRHLGFTTFAYPVGTPEAMYYPMYLEASQMIATFKI